MISYDDVTAAVDWKQEKQQLLSPGPPPLKGHLEAPPVEDGGPRTSEQVTKAFYGVL